MDREIMKKAAILLFLFAGAWKDVKDREISLLLTAVMAVWGILEIAGGEGTLPRLLTAAAAGVITAALSALSGGAVGMGDAIFLTALASLLEPDLFLMVSCLGLFLAGGCSVFLLVVKKKKRDTEIPFLPFLLTAYVGGLCL